jgi:hypothetical protein
MEQHTQPLTRSFDPHFQGGHTDTGEHRHVFVTQILHMLQQESFPLVLIEPLQGAFQFFPPCRALGRMILGGTHEGDVVIDERSLPSAPPRSGSPTAISQDAKEPWSEPLRIIAFGQRSIGSDEGILQRFFRVFPTTKHSYGITAVVGPVSRHNHGVGPGVTSQDASHDCGITVVLDR